MKQRIKNREAAAYVFFLTSEFSQWYPCTFVARNGKTYNSAEQFMMHKKAELFGDHEMADKIMQATTPKEQKELGRQVKNFDVKLWGQHARHIVYEGNYYKFTQNPHLFDVLEATGKKLLVEAAHYDPVWGVGLRADDPLIEDKANWKGENWLGGTLTKLRDDLRDMNFQPVRTPDNHPMIRLYDYEGQRTLYIPAKEFFGGPDYYSAVSRLNGIMNYLNGHYFDDRNEPVMWGAEIVGHGYVENSPDDFYRRNAQFLRTYSSRQGAAPQP